MFTKYLMLREAGRDMNGILLIVGGLILLVLLKQLIDRDWFGLLLSLIALVVVFGTGHQTK